MHCYCILNQQYPFLPQVWAWLGHLHNSNIEAAIWAEVIALFGTVVGLVWLAFVGINNYKQQAQATTQLRAEIRQERAEIRQELCEQSDRQEMQSDKLRTELSGMLDALFVPSVEKRLDRLEKKPPKWSW